MATENEWPANGRFCDELEVIDLLERFYGAVGTPPTIEGSIAMTAAELSTRGSLQAIKVALKACMTVTYPVRLAHILAKIPGTETGDVNAEKRLAWETVERFANRWARWNEDGTYVYIEKGAPKLSQRIEDAVRRSGGWRVYLAMPPKEMGFAQKRFFDEYEAWVDVEQFKISDRARQLEAPATPAAKQLPAAKPEGPAVAKVLPMPKPKPIYEPPTRDQLRDRVAVEKQRLAEYLRNRSPDAGRQVDQGKEK